MREAFEKFGQVNAAEVIIDRRTKRSRGYGFVEMTNDGEARRAIAEMNGSDFKGRELRVDESQPRGQERAREARGGKRSAARKPVANEAPARSGGVFGFFKRLFG